MTYHPIIEDLSKLYRENLAQNRILHPNDCLEQSLSFYAQTVALGLYHGIDHKPKELTKIKHRVLTYIGSYFDTLAPDEFNVTDERLSAGYQPDIELAWKTYFNDEISRNIPIVKNGKGVADRLAKMLFAHMFSMRDHPSNVCAAVDLRHSGDTSTSVDCALVVKLSDSSSNFKISVECKTVQCDEEKDSYMVHCSGPKTVGVCDAYFVILWKKNVKANETFQSVETFLCQIRRIVFITREEFTRAKKLQQSGYRLTFPLLLDPLKGRPGDIIIDSATVEQQKKKKGKKRGILQILVGNEDIDILHDRIAIQKIIKIICEWAIEKS